MKRLFLIAGLAMTLSGSALGADITTWTPSVTAATSSGTVAKGTHSVTFILSSDFVGSITGTAVTGAVVTVPLTFVCQGEHRHPAIAYTRSAGTLFILTER